MSTPVLARDLKPGQRASIDPDGAGRVVAKVIHTFREAIVYWTDSSRSAYAPKHTLYLITPPQEAA